MNTVHVTAKIKSLFIGLQLSNALPFDLANVIIIMKYQFLKTVEQLSALRFLYFNIFPAELWRQADLLVLRSVSTGTRKNYDAAVEKLISFCHSNKIKDKFAPSTIQLFES